MKIDLQKSNTKGPYIQDGRHTAEIESVAEAPGFGGNPGDSATMVEIVFRLGHRKVAKERYYPEISGKRSIGRVIQALLGEIPESFDTDMLEGMPCIVDIKNRRTSYGGLWSGVEEVLPIDEGGKKVSRSVKSNQENIFDEEENSSAAEDEAEDSEEEEDSESSSMPQAHGQVRPPLAKVKRPYKITPAKFAK